MADPKDLASRLDAQLGALKNKIEEFRESGMDTFRGRQERLAVFLKVRQHIKDVAGPRVKTFLDRFAGLVEVKPVPESKTGAVCAEFTAKLASVKMTFAADHDVDVTKVVVKYDLELLPIFIEFERHAELEVPLDKVDDAKVGAWFDDRLVNFAKTWVEIQQNPHYQRDHTEVDPIAGIKVPVTFAKAKLDWQGKTFYFISDETLAEFKKRNSIK